jgi:hypothetical protein
MLRTAAGPVHCPPLILMTAVRSVGFEYAKDICTLQTLCCLLYVMSTTAGQLCYRYDLL